MEALDEKARYENGNLPRDYINQALSSIALEGAIELEVSDDNE